MTSGNLISRVDGSSDGPPPSDRSTRALKGVGVGLRPAFSTELFADSPECIRWVELHPENYIGRGGAAERRLREAMDRFPISAHGLTLCFGNHDEPDPEYLDDLKSFVRKIEAPWYSDHLCFCGFGDAHSHDLLPIPRTEESVEHCARRIRHLRDALDIPIAIENVSAYVDAVEWPLSENEFVSAVLEAADCMLLLDVNNVYVNSKNHDFDPQAFIESLPAERVCQIHMAGHLLRPDGLRIDTHGESIVDQVYELLRFTLRTIGKRPILLERDTNFPSFSEIKQEANALHVILEDAK